MAVYYVIGIALVIWAIALTALGLTREDFPSSKRAGRGLMAVSAVLVLGALVAILVTTEREHPRVEAKAKAAEQAAEEGGTVAEKGAGGQEAGAKQAPGGPVTVIEKEYSIEIPSGEQLEAGPYTLEAVNDGKIQHDLAIEGPSVSMKKTPLIDAGKRADLEVEVVPGRYTLVCTVPGHEQLGMKTELSVK